MSKAQAEEIRRCLELASEHSEKARTYRVFGETAKAEFHEAKRDMWAYCAVR